MSLPVVGERVAGRYELDELIATSDGTLLYRAHDRQLDRIVDLKFLRDIDEPQVEQFRREAMAAAQLSHPDLVTVIDRGSADGHPFVVFEHVEGETLKDVLARGPLPVRRALEIATEIADGLALAHERGLDHGELSTKNVILVDEGRRPVVTEFGDVRSFGALLEQLFAGQEVPTRLRAAIRRAQADGIPMNKLARELEACQADLDADNPTEVIPVARKERAPRVRPPREPLRPLAIFAAVIALVVGAAVTAVFIAQHGGGGGSANATASPRGTVHLHAATAYDPPPGDGQEGNQVLGLATDGNPATAWQTEHYTNQNFGNLKSGVGLVLDAGSAVKLSSVKVTSDTPGYTAKIEAGSASGGPWTTVSGTQSAGRETTFSLRVSSPERYYLLWITKLAPVDQVNVNEVSATE